MSVVDFLTQLKTKGVEVRLKGEGQLGLKAKKGAMTPEIREQLKARKEEIIQFLQQAVGVVKSSEKAPAISHATPEERKVLSFSEERLWFLQRLEPQSSAYNMPTAFRVQGNYQIPVIQMALDALVVRHESLRTRYITRNDVPQRVIDEPSGTSFEVHDLQSEPEESREKICHTRLKISMERPFILEDGPLLRVDFVILNATEAVLLINMHHIISDGWSSDLLNRQFASFYAAFAAGGTVPSSPPKIHFGDYAVWQRKTLNPEALEKHLSFWDGYLADMPTALELPTDKKRPATLSTQGGVVRVQLGANLTAQLVELGRAEGATLFMALIAGWSLVLGKLAGTDDVAIGTPVANRKPGTEALVGFFVNTLVLRFRSGQAGSFRTYLQQIRKMTLEAFAHEDTPFEQVVDRIQTERDMSRSPLFQVMFSLNNTAASDAEPQSMQGLRFSEYVYETNEVKFELNLSLMEFQGAVTGQLTYNGDLFEEASAQRIADRYILILSRLVAEPDTPLVDLDFLWADERQRLLTDLNQTHQTRPETYFPQLFEAQVARDPEAWALLSDDACYTYASCNAYVNQLANYLLLQGVGPDQAVGVCLDRGPEMIMAFMAILKAGGVYLPLDPSYPKERLAYMVADACTALIIGTSSHVSFDHSATLVDPTELSNEIASLSDHNPGRGTHPEQLAYIIYTSGSTGKPKGVGVPMRAMANHSFSVVDRYELTPQDRVLQFCSVSFDMSVKEIFPPLICGAALVLTRHKHGLSSDELKHVIEKHGVTIAALPAAFWHQWTRDLAATNGSPPETLRLLNSGGERANHDLLIKWNTQSKNRLTWINTYGPTETTVNTTWLALQPGEKVPDQLTIGRPLPNFRLYILDSNLQLVPDGAAGQLCVAGVGVTRGYLGKPGLTAPVFIPDPFAKEPGGRLYCTGDRVRYMPDGNIDFLGRVDFQIKLRGFRIETREIEAALGDHPSVGQSLVAIVKDAGGHPTLAAWFTCSGEAPSSDTLRAHCREYLPDYMVPSAFVALETFPLTPAGKIDRKSLPDPAFAGEEAYIAPRTPDEDLLASIWSEILGREQISAIHHFFELGGHSLLATRVISNIRETFGVSLPLKTLFEYPVLADLASVIASSRHGETDQGQVVIKRRPEANQARASFQQERMWFLSRLEPDSTAYNMPRAWRLRGPASPEALAATFETLVARHESLRTRFRDQDGVVYQVIDAVAKSFFTVVDLRNEPAELRDGLCEKAVSDAVHFHFDLERGPLFFAKLFLLEEEDAVLVINLHHILSDGWSNQLLANEFAAIYMAYYQDRPVPLDPLPLHYGDYAHWQRSTLDEAGLEKEFQWWEERLEGCTTVLELPCDFSRPAMLSAEGGSVSFHFDQQTAHALDQVGHEQKTTRFMTLVACYAVVLSRYAGQNDLNIGTPVANRETPGVDSIVGFFVNTLLLRFQLNDQQGFADWLSQIRQMILEAYGHAELPFEKLTDRMQPERDLSRSPLFQVMFLYNNLESLSDTTHPNLGDLVMDPYPLGTSDVKFELTLSLSQDQEGISGLLEYHADLFTAKTAQRFVNHYKTLLQRVLADPSLPISCVSMLDEAEEKQLLLAWNARDTADQPGLMINGFAQMVAHQPGALALVCGDQQLTYGELDARSNQLAHQLRAWGVGPERTVGIAMDRTVELIIGQLATLKAGGAYVPLDPAYPEDRLTYMMEDGAVTALLSREHIQTNFPATSAHVFCFGRDDGLLTDLPSTPPTNTASPENLGYLIYTSGSTGRPKGVAIPHSCASALISWSASAFSDEDLSGVLASTSINFDLSIFEIFVTLNRGGAVWLVENALALIEQVLPVTLINTVPSAARELVRADAVPDSVRVINLAGEPLKNQLVQALYQQSNVDRVYNLYGPSEDTTYSTFTLAARDVDTEPTIGAPIAGTQAYILDRHSRLNGVGVPGEICLAGEGVTRGYLNNPAMTAEKFVPNPFATGDQAGSRMYRCGDLGRHRPDAPLDCADMAFLGRVDHQVKVRGFRIEIGEIERVLASHERVGDAVVKVWGDEDKYLAAYTEGVKEEDTAQLRSWLQERLPDYMVPARIVALYKLPQTPNGKIDRKRLPEPAYVAQEQGLPLRTHEEQVLGRIWCSLLSREEVFADDHFFSLGGHSLLGTRLMTRVQDEFGTRLPLKTLFEAPILRDFAAILSRSSVGHLPAIDAFMVRRENADSAPLSFSQERLWFLNQLEPDSSAYNMPMAWKINGRLHISDLQATMTMLASRHESLRTRFDEQEGIPFQIIDAPGPVHFEHIKLTDHPEAQRESICREQVLEQARKPFDLANGPLMRTCLFQLDTASFVLLINVHHIVSDGWSNQVLAKEFAQIFSALHHREPVNLQPDELQYGDYAQWLRAWMTEDAIDDQVNWWVKQLEGAPAALEMPCDLSRPAMLGAEAGNVSFGLDAKVLGDLDTLCANSGATRFMALLSAFACLLSRYTGQDGVCLGTPVANRNRSELEGMVGFFVNTLVMFIRCDEHLSYGDLLKHAKDVALDAYGHQEVPFERLVDRLCPERDLSRSPLFQAMFLYNNFESQDNQGPELPGLEMTGYPLDSHEAKFELTMAIGDAESGLVGSLDYHEDLFERRTAQQMVQHFQNLLAQMLAHPKTPLWQLAMESDDERRQLLFHWNASGEVGHAQLMVSGFAQMVAQQPGALALVCGEQKLTYGELDVLSNQLAHQLQAWGVGPERTVGIAMDRTVELIVGQLATLKTGGAYVPLDPAYPEDRLTYMMEDGAVTALLSREHIQTNFPATSAHVFCFGRDDGLLVDLPTTPPANTASPENLGYLIYTSGSTGKPKGVAIPHACASALISWSTSVFSDEDLRAVLASTSINFDLSIFEIFVTLNRGGAVWLVENALALIEQALPVTLINTVPSAARELVRADAIPDSVRVINLAGEPLKNQLVQALYQQSNADRVYNLYGPSEDTTYSTFTLAARDVDIEPTIGAPIAGTQAYILDRHSRLNGVGVPGEICLAGEGVTRGYLNNPGMTAEKFVPNPFATGDQAGSRMYRCGDLGRHRPDAPLDHADMVFLGRVDHQVKVRGFRIEIGEIERVLASHGNVGDAVVKVWGDEDKYLAAYTEGVTEEDTALLRSWLQERLPDYMVPARIVALDKLPQTPNGKIDRKRLREPAYVVQEQGLPLRTHEEQVLGRIWSSLLSREEVFADDHFFSLGGHSLLGTRLMTRVQDEFGTRLPLKTLFEAPVLQDFAAILSRSSVGHLPETDVPIVRREKVDSAPLSFSQERLWFLNQLEPDSSAYNMPMAWTINGHFHISDLQATITMLASHHESLRTRFQEQGGIPVQIIDPPGPVHFEHINLADYPKEQREGICREQVLEQARKPFDLANGPLMRTYLYQLDTASFVLLINVHHIISDGWSNQVLAKEFTQIFSALHHREPVNLQPDELQYGDYAQWLRSWMTEEAIEAQVNWWAKQLEGAPAALEMPCDFSRPAMLGAQAGNVSFHIDAKVLTDLDALCADNGATRFMALMSAFACLLSRYSGQEGVCLGTPVANRNRTELEGMVGFFVNTLVMFLQCDEHSSYRDLLKHTKGIALDAYGHQEVPFERLVDRLCPERDLSRSPLFQAMFLYNNFESQDNQGPELPGLEMAGYSLDSHEAKFELTMALGDAASGLSGSLDYHEDLFGRRTAHQMVQHFQNLLAQMLANPQTPLWQLAMENDDERRQLLFAWNASGEVANAQLMVSGFAQMAAQQPGALALVCGEQKLTYAELDARSNQLAHQLKAWGVGPERTVGIAMDRTVELIVGQLATLKAGGAYVPLDPAYPEDRLTYMMEDGSVTALLSREHIQANIPATSAHIFCFGRDEGLLADLPTTPPSNTANPENLGYLIYTSGSTGRPKGVAIPHACASALISWSASVFPNEDLRGVLASTSINFDLSIFEIFVTLNRGGAVWLVENALALIEQALPVTLINTVPSAARELVRADAVPDSVRVINLAGEPLKNQLVQALYQQSNADRVYNLYGPSEDTTYSTFTLAARDVDTEPTIGAPIAGTQAYILDRHSRLNGMGVPGEICLAGEGVTRGYLNNPAMTAEKFVPNPFATDDQSGSRMYRCGDLGRHRPDAPSDCADMAFLGRVDHQVKVRGFRIEIGEIERVLASHENVGDAVVKVWGDEDKYLAAYTEGVTEEDTALLRSWLQERLPDYMVPARIVALDKLPQTPNGKIDRKRLPEPGYVAQEQGLPLRTHEEQVLGSIWSSLLSREEVFADDHFFSLGGHSLLGTRLMTRVQDEFGTRLPLKTLFEAPILRDFAAILSRSGVGHLPENDVPMVRREKADSAPLSFSQERLWFLSQLEPDSSAYNMPMAWKIHGRVHISDLQATMTMLASHHESLRTRFQEQEGIPVQIIDPPGPVHFEHINLADHPEEQREGICREQVLVQARKPFDLAEGPLMRTSLYQLDVSSYVLLINVHHIISDGWSNQILAKEFAQIFGALHHREPVNIQPEELQYGDYAQWLRTWMTEDAINAQVNWWVNQLEGAPAALEMPCDFSRPAMLGAQAGNVSFDIDAKVLSNLDALCADSGATRFMALMSAFACLLSRYSGQDGICLGTPVANRNRSELEGMVGFFVNTLVMFLQCDEHSSYGDLLKHAKDVALDAYGHQEVPFERLVDRLCPERDLSRSPLFQAMFLYNNFESQDNQGPELPGLEMAGYPLESHEAKFELTMAIGDAESGLSGSLDYHEDLFQRRTALQMVQHFQNLLGQMLAHPQTPLWQLAMESDDERKQLLFDWNASGEVGPAQLMVSGFAQMVAQQPGALALVCGEQKLSYRELDAQSNQLAHQLQAWGVGPERTVGIAMDRTVELIVGQLATLKAGGAYVPLDPAYPEDRLTYMMEDGAVTALLSREHIQANFPATSAHVFCFGRDEELLADLPTSPPTNTARPENLGYLIYTSGSTGRPKGVAIPHACASALISWSGSVFSGEDLRGVLASTSINFDLSIFEIFVTLNRGGAVWLVENALALIEQALPVTLINTVPSAARELVRADAVPDSVRVINLAGEPLKNQLVQALYQQSNADRVYNLYGPSEDTTYSTFTLAARDVDTEPTIGAPIAGTQAYILDRHGRLNGVGVPGEICLTGEGVTRGYLNNPAMTAEKFIPNPFATGDQAGSRMYRCGDLGRHRTDAPSDCADMAFLGRVDHQVKIRGFRIEIGEIERVLASHESVGDAVVKVWGDEDKYLAAYVEGASEDQEAELRQWMAARLPEYMVPSHLVIMDALPLTPNGKIDRKSLPEVDAVSVKGYVPLSDALELALSRVFGELFDRKGIGAGDDFFKLGGNSLLAVRLVAKIKRAMGVKLPLTSVFQASTVADLARLIRESKGTPPPVGGLVPLRDTGSDKCLFLVHPVGGSVFCYQNLVAGLAGDRSVFAFQAPGLEEECKPMKQFQKMAKYYLKGLLSVQPKGPFWLGGWSVGGVIALEMAQQLKKQGHEVGGLILMDSFATQMGAPPDDLALEGMFVSDLWGLGGASLSLNAIDATGMTKKQRARLFLTHAKSAGMIDQELSLNRFQALFDVYRENLLGAYAYKAAPFDHPVLLLEAEGRRRASEDWSPFLKDMEIVGVEGDHYAMLSPPAVTNLAAVVSSWLAKTESANHNDKSNEGDDL